MNNNYLLLLIIALLFLKFALIGLYNVKKECYNSFKKEEQENKLFKKIERMRVWGYGTNKALYGDLENIIRGIERKYQGSKVLVTVKNEDDEGLLLNMPSDDLIRYGSLHLLRCEVESFEEFELKEFVTLDVVIDF